MSRPRNSDRNQIRNERISLAVTRATFDGVKTLAAMQGISTNDFIASLVESVVKKNAPVIEEFAAAQKSFVAKIDLNVDSGAVGNGGDNNENP